MTLYTSGSHAAVPVSPGLGEEELRLRKFKKNISYKPSSIISLADHDHIN
jgi:hypothetical protein